MGLFNKDVRTFFELPREGKIPKEVLYRVFGQRAAGTTYGQYYRDVAELAADTYAAEIKRQEREARNRRYEKRVVGSFRAIYISRKGGDEKRFIQSFRFDMKLNPKKFDFEKYMRTRANENAEMMMMDSKLDAIELVIADKLFYDVVPDNINRQTVPMFRASVKIDGVDFQEWENNTKGNCVVKALRYKYNAASYRMKHALTDEAMVKAFNKVPITHNREYDDEYDSELEDDDSGLDEVVRDMNYYNVNGVTIQHINSWCDCYNIPMYALDINNNLIARFNPDRVNKNAPALCFMMSQGHFYLTCGRIKQFSNRGKFKGSYTGRNTLTKALQTRYNADEAVYHENIDDPERFMIEMMDRCNTVVAQPFANIIVRNKEIQSFKLKDKTHYINQDKATVEGMCERLGMPFTGQTKAGILAKIMTDTFGDNKSYYSPNAYKQLEHNAVKDRSHVGGYDANIIHKLKEEGRLKCYDINKCYTACMLEMSDDLMLFGVEDDFTRYTPEYDDESGEVVYKPGLYTVSTDDDTLFHGNNAYSHTMLRKAQAEGIDFVVKTVMRSHRSVSKATMAEAVRKIYDVCGDNKELKKFMCNMMSGIFGITTYSRSHLLVTMSKPELLAFANEYQALWSFREIDHRDRTYYVAEEVCKQPTAENNLPWFIQIKDEANIRLYDMSKKMRGEVVYRKVDLTVVADGVAIETDDRIGGYKEAEIPTALYQHRNTAITFEKNRGWKKLGWLQDSDQAEAIFQEFVKGTGMMLQGRGGTGKSHVARDIADKLGDECLTLAPTNKAALNVGGRTIHLAFGLSINSSSITKKVICAIAKKYKYIVVDEVSMIGRYLLRVLYDLKKTTDIKFLLVGDHRQLPPVEKNGLNDYYSTSVMKTLAGYMKVELTKRKRYDKELWDISERVSNGEIWVGQKLPEGKLTKINLCYTNHTRRMVNKTLNDRYKTKDAICVLPHVEIKNDVEIQDEQAQVIWLHKGLPVIARCNVSKDDEDEMLVVNNEYYTVETYDHENVTCVSERVNDDGGKYPHRFVVKIDEFQKYFLMNYCSTVHKAQGETITEEYTIWDWDVMNQMDDQVFARKLKYTAITRGVNVGNIYFN